MIWIFKWFMNLFKKKEIIEPDEYKITRIENQLIKVKEELIALLPEELQDSFRYSYISGGCIYSLWHSNTPKDYDFFLESKDLADKIHEHFLNASEYKGSEMCGGVFKNLPLVVTSNAVTIGKFQIITKHTGTPFEVLNQFDFKHNQCYFQNGNLFFLSGIKFIKSKELKYNHERARDIVGTLMRVPRFLKRGMTINNSEFAKMLLKLHEVGFNDEELRVLRDAGSSKHFGS